MQSGRQSSAVTPRACSSLWAPTPAAVLASASVLEHATWASVSVTITASSSERQHVGCLNGCDTLVVGHEEPPFLVSCEAGLTAHFGPASACSQEHWASVGRSQVATCGTVARSFVAASSLQDPQNAAVFRLSGRSVVTLSVGRLAGPRRPPRPEGAPP